MHHISRLSRAVTSQKCTKKYDALAELLFCSSNLFFFLGGGGGGGGRYRFRCCQSHCLHLGRRVCLRSPQAPSTALSRKRRLLTTTTTRKQLIGNCLTSQLKRVSRLDQNVSRAVCQNFKT